MSRNWISPLLAALLMTACSMSFAQSTSADNAASTSSPSAKPKKSAAQKGEAASGAKRTRTSSRTQLKTKTQNIAAGIRAADAALTPEEMAIAERVHVGKLPCELGANVSMSADPKAPGYFDLQGKGFSYRMFPVVTSTGAVRLEDRKAGAVWLQLANKSMLMDQKRGLRLADECYSPAQATVAQSLKLNPPPSLLDKPQAVPKPSVDQDPLAQPTP